MTHWDPRPPTPSTRTDHAVQLEGDHLQGKRIALLITGGIAAMKAPMLARALRRQGADVTAFVSDEGLRFVTADTLAWATDRPVVSKLGPRAEHLSDSDRFHAYLVAPATYNTINKMACGIADGPLTATLASALGRLERGECAVLVCPTMHGSMHTRILTESLERLQRFGVTVVPPRDDSGKHNLPDEEPIVVAVSRATSTSPLRGKRILVTGGPVPTALDAVRRIGSRFTGALGVEIARDLAYRGADVNLILGTGSVAAPPWLHACTAHSVEEYSSMVLSALGASAHQSAVLSAAVADFEPAQVRAGKVKTADGSWTVQLQPTAKVIDAIHKQFPALHMVGFKYEENSSHEGLMAIARQRAAIHGACVANRGEENARGTTQVAWLVTPGHDPIRLEGKPAIAAAIRMHLEQFAATHRMAHN
ncbi:MAG: bifunctional phosphopantothenoylcysteine decarboxylase/phosphopantothenate--cysteine ligase CoaBC [Phycisphaerales bacterium]|nr:bifunctional phosphopantothenoylcysteine decarboxylase/phosphopantothenate--cysteine ligase CoaBC [Phycisphaerales bacterium]